MFYRTFKRFKIGTKDTIIKRRNTHTTHYMFRSIYERCKMVTHDTIIKRRGKHNKLHVPKYI